MSTNYNLRWQTSRKTNAFRNKSNERRKRYFLSLRAFDYNPTVPVSHLVVSPKPRTITLDARAAYASYHGIWRAMRRDPCRQGDREQFENPKSLGSWCQRIRLSLWVATQHPCTRPGHMLVTSICAARHVLYSNPTAPSNNSRVTSHLISCQREKTFLSSAATQRNWRPHRSHNLISRPALIGSA